jgi:hypothetical protein
MGKCKFKTRSGPCGTQTKKGWKCSIHKSALCAVCEAPAWQQCPWPRCNSNVCRDASCLVDHLKEKHEGKHPHDYSAHKKRTGERVDRNPDKECRPCTHCESKETIPNVVTVTPGQDGGVPSYHYVECSSCYMTGPRSKTSELARNHWNMLPRCRPQIYESLRNKALQLLESYLSGLEKSKRRKPTTEEAIAIAKALESATVAVDTWE